MHDGSSYFGRLSSHGEVDTVEHLDAGGLADAAAVDDDGDDFSAIVWPSSRAVVGVVTVLPDERPADSDGGARAP